MAPFHGNAATADGSLWPCLSVGWHLGVTGGSSSFGTHAQFSVFISMFALDRISCSRRMLFVQSGLAFGFTSSADFFSISIWIFNELMIRLLWISCVFIVFRLCRISFRKVHFQCMPYPYHRRSPFSRTFARDHLLFACISFFFNFLKISRIFGDGKANATFWADIVCVTGVHTL